ncbi:unnamed protein product [Clavelina lepadiformis]|uniref:Large ribosomal subunit protein uL23m n=1 Tax=Clavelina lepadiformis TaxID=159417 RepID=A0ABP0FVN1_CLALP
MSRRIRIPGKLPSVKFPLHYEGAPQRRLFIPEWYITLAKPKEKMPKNYVRFHVPADMTKYDMKEYLDKIYNTKVLNVRLSPVNYVRYKEPLPWRIKKMSEDAPTPYQWKFIEPWKIAHIFLADEQEFEFPNPLKNEDDEENEMKLTDMMEAQMKAMKPKKNGGDNKSKMLLENSWF